MPFVALSTISGGHARVGLEDNVFIERGVLAKTNAELVTRAVRIIRDMGRDVATPKEVRELLKLDNYCYV
jgi:3-keto-5-aminohexanoate cleavage enzyme